MTPAASHPRIETVRVRAVRVPMPAPHQTASGTVSESPLVLTDVIADDGTVGHSIVFTYTVMALEPTAVLVRNLGALIAGEPLAPGDIDRALARLHATSLVRLLGGVPRPVPVYGAIGYDGAERAARVAEGWAARGFGGVKAKIGYPTVQEDVAVIRAIRQAMGPGAAIMVDYNQSLTPTEAVQRIRVLDDEGLEWVEEPTLAHDYAGHAHVAARVRTPIQCGENWWGITDLQHAIDAGASDYVMPDVMKIGGVSGWLRAAALAQGRGLKVSSHLWPEISAQLLSVTPTAHWLEYADWWNPIVSSPLVIDGGVASVEDAAGTGVAWNEPAIAEWLV